MDDLTSQPWFPWTVALIVVLPVCLVVLSELHQRLERSGNSLAGPVNRLRLWLLPLAGLLVLLTRAGDLGSENDGVRVVATVVGVLAVSVALGGLNAVLFGNAARGSWRDRLPGIFIDLARLVLIVTGGAVVASFVWGLDVGGWFAALGVGSIVIGLALQNAIGSVVAGLLLLFEQPFRLGDTLEVEGVSGKVVEMNWRSTHVDTGAGIQIIPNATIAGASFANLSRPTPAHDHTVSVAFAADDPPHEVVATLTSVADALPMLRPGGRVAVRPVGGGQYAVRLPLVTAGDVSGAEATFLNWLWYAARRDEISLDGQAFVQRPREDVLAALRLVATTLEVDDDEVEELAGECEIETFAPGEPLTAVGLVPRRYMFVHSGVVALMARTPDGAVLEVTRLDAGDVIAANALLREPAAMVASAVSVVEVLLVPLARVDAIVGRKPRVARVLSDLAGSRRDQLRQALESLTGTARGDGLDTHPDLRLGPLR